MHVVIECNYLPGHDWISFACWYSIYENLPDASVEVYVERSFPKWTLFNWPRKINVPLKFGKNKNINNQTGKKVISVPFCTMAVRSYNKDSIVSDIRSENFSTFVTYLNRCAGFNTDRWINSLRAPFDDAERKFRTLDCYADEIKVLKQWERMLMLHSSL